MGYMDIGAYQKVGMDIGAYQSADGSTPTGTNIQLNIGDTWKTVDAVQVNIGDVWKAVESISVNIGDTWKTVY